MDADILEWDLGDVTAGSSVVITLWGAESDVFLLSPENLARLRASEPFSFVGGHYQGSRVRLLVPTAGHWHVAVVPGPAGAVEASIQLTQAA